MMSATTEVRAKAIGHKRVRGYISVKDQGGRQRHFNWVSKDGYDLYNCTNNPRKIKHHDMLYGDQHVQGHSQDGEEFNVACW